MTISYKDIIKLQWPNKTPTRFTNDTYAGIVWNDLDATPNPTQQELDTAIAALNNSTTKIKSNTALGASDQVDIIYNFDLSDSGVTPGYYTAANITVNSKGIITNASPTVIGTVTNVSVANANGVSGTVATSTTTPVLTIDLGDIAPTSIAATGTISGTNISGSVSGANTGDETAVTIKSKLGISTLSGANTGDETQSTIYSKLGISTLTGSNTGDETTLTIKSKLGITTLSGSNTGDQTIALTGDVTGSGTGSFAATLATVNSSPQTDTFRKLTVNGKGLVTATSPVSASDITTALGYTPYNSTNPAGYSNATGTVTSASIVNANGFAGTVATATTVPSITLSTTVNGLVKGNGTAISAATAGTDYSAGTSTLATGILKSTTSTGALSIAVAGDFPTLNQSTTGNAATATTLQTARNINGVAFNGSADITIAAAATTLTGTALPNTVVGSSLTSVGTLTGLTSSGAVSITNTTASTGIGTGALVVGGGASVGGNMYVSGNLSVLGTLTYVNSTSINVTDPLIYLASGNTSNSVDIGLAGAYTIGGVEKHTGFVRDASDNVWKLFDSVTTEPTTTIDFTTATYAPVQLGALTATSGTFSGAVSASAFTGALSGNATTATTLANARTINGVSFNGSANITVTAAAGTLTGTTLNSTVTASSLTSVGTLTSLTVTGNITGGNLSGTNTGDETATTIKTKLGVTTLSGNNTGDETSATILSKLGLTTLTGSNTGDETTASIQSKLGVTTLSGSNTGDQTITLTGDVTGSGTGSFITALSTTGVTAGTYTKLTVDAKGRATAGSQLASSDVTTALGYTPVNPGAAVALTSTLSVTGNITAPSITGLSSIGLTADSAVPLSYLQANYSSSGASGAGSVLQTISSTVPALSGTTVITLSNNTPLITDGVQLWSATITPKSTSSKININGSFSYSSSQSTRQLVAYVFRGSTCIGATAAYISTTLVLTPVVIDFQDTPSSTAAQTYSIRVAGVSTQTWYVNQYSTARFNGMLARSTITLQEIS